MSILTCMVNIHTIRQMKPLQTMQRQKQKLQHDEHASKQRLKHRQNNHLVARKHCFQNFIL